MGMMGRKGMSSRAEQSRYVQVQGAACMPAKLPADCDREFSNDGGVSSGGLDLSSPGARRPRGTYKEPRGVTRIPPAARRGADMELDGP